MIDDDDYMCPNCVTPWRCNGPHWEEPPQWEGDVRSMVEDRRFRLVLIDPEVFLALFKSHKVDGGELVSNLPADARVLGWEEGTFGNTLNFLVWSASFEPLEETATIPFFEIVVTYLEDAA